MSIGVPSNLGTLLIQRLDAVLGTTLGQQANVVSGAQPNAVTQPGNPKDPNAPHNQTQRHPREAVDKASARDQGQAAIGKATNAQTAESRTGHSATHTNATPSAPTTLGFAARTILALLAKYPESVPLVRGQSPLLGQSATPGAPSPLPGNLPAPTTALLQGIAANRQAGVFATWANLAASIGQPGVLSAQFAHSLMQAVHSSGLFYESHLANLAFGKTTVQALQQEPQGQPSLASSRTQQGPAPAQNTTMIQEAGTSITTQSSHLGASQTHSAPTQQAPIPGVDPQIQPLVRQQLEVLAYQNFAWQGEAWPGATMRWEIERRDQDAAPEQAADSEHWTTHLNLQLPALGEVQARLTLTGDQLVMRLVAPASADHLNKHIEDLRGRLLAHGLKTSQLSIINHKDLLNKSGHESRPKGGGL